MINNIMQNQILYNNINRARARARTHAHRERT